MECFLSLLHVRVAVHLQLCVSSSWLQCKRSNVFCTAHITHIVQLYIVQLCAQSETQCARTCSVGITARCCHQKDPRKETGERCCCEKRCENPDFPPCFSKFLSRLERRGGKGGGMFVRFFENGWRHAKGDKFGQLSSLPRHFGGGFFNQQLNYDSKLTFIMLWRIDIKVTKCSSSKENGLIQDNVWNPETYSRVLNDTKTLLH